MPAYVVFIMRDVKDRARLQEYWSQAGPTMAGHPIKPLAAYSECQVLEGSDAVNGVVIAEFPTMDAAQAWYRSAAYTEVKQHRLAGADFLTLLVDGKVSLPSRGKGAG